jgi:hypothetical protein
MTLISVQPTLASRASCSLFSRSFWAFFRRTCSSAVGRENFISFRIVFKILLKALPTGRGRIQIREETCMKAPWTAHRKRDAAMVAFRTFMTSDHSRKPNLRLSKEPRADKQNSSTKGHPPPSPDILKCSNTACRLSVHSPVLRTLIPGPHPHRSRSCAHFVKAEIRIVEIRSLYGASAQRIATAVCFGGNQSGPGTLPMSPCCRVLVTKS